jgi:hypothetical protein
LGSTIYHTIILGLPSAELMGGIAVLARGEPGLGADGSRPRNDPGGTDPHTACPLEPDQVV